MGKLRKIFNPFSKELFAQVQRRRELELSNVIHSSVISKSLSTPPTNPLRQDIYIIGPSPTDEWAGKQDYITIWGNNLAWIFIAPRKSMIFWVEDEEETYEYSGTAWDYIEEPYFNVDLKSTSYSISKSEHGRVFTNEGASGSIALALPPTSLGLHFRFRVSNSNELKIMPTPPDKIWSPHTGLLGSSDKDLFSGNNGDTVHLCCSKIGEWSILAYFGQWKLRAE